MATQKQGRTRKHVTLTKFVKDGVTAFELIGPDGKFLQGFSLFSNALLDVPFNTRVRYCSSVADFYDYYFEAALYLKSTSHNNELSISELSRSELFEIIDTWSEYQIYGKDSGNPPIFRAR